MAGRSGSKAIPFNAALLLVLGEQQHFFQTEGVRGAIADIARCNMDQHETSQRHDSAF